MMLMVGEAASPSPPFVLCENDPCQQQRMHESGFRNASLHKSRIGKPLHSRISTTMQDEIEVSMLLGFIRQQVRNRFPNHRNIITVSLTLTCPSSFFSLTQVESFSVVVSFRQC